MQKRIHLLGTFFLGLLWVNANAQVGNKSTLQTASIVQAKKELQLTDSLKKIAAAKNWKWQLSSTQKENITLLTGVDAKGLPIYTTTFNNSTAAATTNTNQLWMGGSTNLNLNGNSNAVNNKLAIWDGGKVMPNHIELVGRITQKDVSGSNSSHSTHVAGTMVAKGINANARGMAYGLQNLDCYDFNNHLSEMMSAANGLLVSNHSYGTVAGWRQTGSNWEFWGEPTANEDYKFGFYNDEAELWDSIAYNTPNYLIVKAAGNNRNANGPAVGQPYYRLDASGMIVAAGNRPAGISNNDGYDIIPTYGCAKNILTVGAVQGLVGGYSKPSDVVQAALSSWGPTDDGRIKPDLVAMGVDVFSTTANSTTSYEMYTGTSMATPSVSGSLLLLQEHYANLNAGSFMRSATLKALTIHTAEEAGNAPGPDYQNGWGLLNAEKAAAVITANNTGSHRIIQQTLNNNQTYTLNVVASGKGKLVATLVWTDPKGTVSTSNLLNNPALKLVHDLDMSITQGANTFMPWILNPASPANAATKGDNFRDNVEKIEIDNAIPGQTYTITINHKGNLQRGNQAFSLIVSGVGGTSYCSSIASTTVGARIDNVTISNINQNTTGCTNYNSYTNTALQLEANKNYTYNISVSSCDATVNNKFVKLYIDYNQNGIFTDANELIATSNAIASNGVFSGSFSVPNSISPNNFSLLRVVLQETNDANTINPCNTYSRGETQDYRVEFIAPSIDVALIAVTNPAQQVNAIANQYVSVLIKNLGTTAITTGINLTAEVKKGATTIANLTGTYAPSLAAGATADYTFQNAVATDAASNYSILATATTTNDQTFTNNTLTANLTTLPKATNATGTAVNCGNNALLKVTNATAGTNYFWYNSNTATTPIAAGTNATSSAIASTYFLGTGGNATIGLANKNLFPNGGGYQATGGNYFNYTATVPARLDNARIYTAFPGKITFLVADITGVSADGTYRYIVLDSVTIDAQASRPTQAMGSVSVNDPADLGLIYNLGLTLPSGNHSLIGKTDGVANIFRNNNVTGNPYPFTVPGMLSLNNNNASSPGDPNFFQGFYYYLYNMNISTLDALSDRVAINPTTSTTPTITKQADTLISSPALGYQWIKDGVDIMFAQNQKYTVTTNGSYAVRTTDANGCQLTSAARNVVPGMIDPPLPVSNDMLVFPNPAKGMVNVQFDAGTNESYQLNVYTLQGKLLSSQTFSATGTITKQLNIANLPTGIYVVALTGNEKMVRKKLMVR